MDAHFLLVCLKPLHPRQRLLSRTQGIDTKLSSKLKLCCLTISWVRSGTCNDVSGRKSLAEAGLRTCTKRQFRPKFADPQRQPAANRVKSKARHRSRPSSLGSKKTPPAHPRCEPRPAIVRRSWASVHDIKRIASGRSKEHRSEDLGRS